MMDNMEEKIKHLEMIQNVINRMAANSFSLKEWSVSITCAIVALSTGNCNNSYLITLIPIVLFCLLDSYYLQQERLYRSLYEKVRSSGEIPAFSLDVSSYENEQNNKYCKCVFSKTEIMFYLPIAIITAII